MAYDPSLYAASAPHYLKGRPPYSAALLDVLRAELGLDGTGVLLDAGCGPGVLAVQLAAAFGAVIGLDPDAAMLAAAAGHAAANGVDVTWVHARAEDIPTLALPPARLVTFGQSFQWTDRRLVLDAVFDVLEPGGSIALVSHDIAAGPPPVTRPEPPIPHDEIRALIARYLGPAPRAGRGLRPIDDERYEVSLSRSRFGPPRRSTRPAAPTSCAAPTRSCRTTCRCRTPRRTCSAPISTRSWPTSAAAGGRITGGHVLGLARAHVDHPRDEAALTRSSAVGGRCSRATPARRTAGTGTARGTRASTRCAPPPTTSRTTIVNGS